MKNPLPWVALLYAGGLCLGQYVPCSPVWLLAMGFALVISALAVASIRARALALLLPIVGWANFAVQRVVLSPHDLRTTIGTNAAYVTIRGNLEETPVLRIHESGKRVIQRSAAEVNVGAIGIEGDWARAAGRVMASTTGVLGPEFHSGLEVEITGVIQRPRGPVSPGQLDYRAYLESRGIFHQLRCESTNDWEICALKEGRSAGSVPLTDRFARWAQGVLRMGLPAEDESLHLLWAMVLGWKTGLTPEVAETFMQSGTLHIFAISGLHIALIAGILVSLLRVLRVSRGASGLLVIPLIWFYTAATGWQASAIRSTVMMTIVITGWALERPSHLINSLAAAGLVILIWDPGQLFQAGFQLSFFVVLGIALLMPPLERARDRLLRPDPLLPPELRPPWQRRLDAPLRLVSTSVATSVAAWLGSLPLIAWYFYMITPGSLLANLLIVPLSSLALMSSLGSLVCGDWFPQLTVVFNHSSWFWMVLMVRLSAWFATLPVAWFYIPQPPVLLSLLYYAFLGILLSGFAFAPGWRVWTGGLAAAAAVSGVCAAVWSRGEVRVTVLPVRCGAIFIDEPGRSADLLVDCGDEASVLSVTKPFLRSQGVNRLSTLLLTHGDVAHAGGAESLRTHFSIGTVLTSSTPFRSRVYRQLIANLRQTGVPLRELQRGDVLGRWTVLHPSAADRSAQGANNALVLRGDFYGTRILLASDLGRLGQRTLLGREANISTDILIIGPASGEEAIGEALVRAAQPRLLIVACPDFPASAVPTRKFRERMDALGVPVIYTSDSGAAVLRFRKDGWKASQPGRDAPRAPGY